MYILIIIIIIIISLSLSLSQEDRSKIVREVEILQQLNHPHVIHISDAWEDKQRGEIVFITELMTSGTLKEFRIPCPTVPIAHQPYHQHLLLLRFLARVPIVPIKVVKKWCCQILNGLSYLHNHKPPIIHRDIKCDNIFMNGSRGELKIGDLGLSYVMNDTRFAVSVIGALFESFDVS